MNPVRINPLLPISCVFVVCFGCWWFCPQPKRPVVLESEQKGQVAAAEERLQLCKQHFFTVRMRPELNGAYNRAVQKVAEYKLDPKNVDLAQVDRELQQAYQDAERPAKVAQLNARIGEVRAYVLHRQKEGKLVPAQATTHLENAERMARDVANGGSPALYVVADREVDSALDLAK